MVAVVSFGDHLPLVADRQKIGLRCFPQFFDQTLRGKFMCENRTFKNLLGVLLNVAEVSRSKAGVRPDDGGLFFG